MTRERFIKKWLGNKDYQYTEENRDLMRDDLDEVISQALRIHDVVGRSEQLADHQCKPMVNADWTYLRCECGKRFEPKG